MCFFDYAAEGESGVHIVSVPVCPGAIGADCAGSVGLLADDVEVAHDGYDGVFFFSWFHNLDGIFVQVRTYFCNKQDLATIFLHNWRNYNGIAVVIYNDSK